MLACIVSENLKSLSHSLIIARIYLLIVYCLSGLAIMALPYAIAASSNGEINSLTNSILVLGKLAICSCVSFLLGTAGLTLFEPELDKLMDRMTKNR